MVSLLPNIFTTLNLFAGFYAIIASFEEKYLHSAIGILFALIFDVFDGRIARFTGQSTRFGREYDSLADMVSFGVAPALLIYNFSLRAYSKMGWLACFLYTACVALRLARFNIKQSSSSYFEGLPSPAGAAIIASMVLFLIKTGVEPLYKNWILLILIYILAYLLVSNLKYPSFKEFKVNSLQNFYFLVLFVLILTISASNPPLSIFVITLLYASLGPLILFKRAGSRIYRNWFKKEKK